MVANNTLSRHSRQVIIVHDNKIGSCVPRREGYNGTGDNSNNGKCNENDVSGKAQRCSLIGKEDMRAKKRHREGAGIGWRCYS